MDVWCDGEAFCESFPSLFALAVNKEALVLDLWDSSREEGSWIPCFARPFNGWELEELLCFLQAIQGKRVIASQDDLMVLKEASDGRFSMRHLF